MVDSQPGQVLAFNPSITLTSYSADVSKDKLLFNENQLVLVKDMQHSSALDSDLSVPVPASVSLYTYSDENGTLTQTYTYYNEDGDFTYFDGLYYLLKTNGFPYQNIHKIEFTFAATTPTISNITIWSTTEITSTYLSGWTETFDDTKQTVPGEDPPLGLWKYTKNPASSILSYSIVSSLLSTTVNGTQSSSAGSLTVNSTSGFPTSGEFLVMSTSATNKKNCFLGTYTGKSTGSFTGVVITGGTGVASAITEITGVGSSMRLTIASGAAVAAKGVIEGRYNGAGCPGPLLTIFYTGKSGNTLTGCTIIPDVDAQISAGPSCVPTTVRAQITAGRYEVAQNTVPSQIASGTKVVWPDSFSNPTFNGVTEIELTPSAASATVLKHWNSDGTQAVSNLVEGEDYYDFTYDKNDDVYYAIRFNEDLKGSNFSVNDDFTTGGVGTLFDPIKWIESSTNTYFDRNTASGTLDYRVPFGPGQLSGNYKVSGNFIYSIDLVSLVQLGALNGDFFALQAKEYDSGNQRMLTGIKGAYTPPSVTTGKWISSIIKYEDTFGGVAQLNDFTLDPRVIYFANPTGQTVYDMQYNLANDYYKVYIDGTEQAAPAYAGKNYVVSGVSFTVSQLGNPFDGQKFTVTAYTNEASIINSNTASGISIQLERLGTNGYARYKEAQDGSYTTLLANTVPSSIDIRPEIYAVASGTVNVGADNFTMTSGTITFERNPVFSVVTINKEGELQQVSGVSDTDGYVIKQFDVIRDVNAQYGDYATIPKVALTTNGLARSSGGELYIKVGTTLYRYVKTSFPLTIETGSSAVASTTGEIPSTGITNFAYNGYSQAGLSYVMYDSTLVETLVKTVDKSTLLAKSKKIWLDIASINYPLAWNVSDLATLYYTDGTALKLYDLNETKAGFVVVTSSKQVLAAGTAETATVTAQVLNVYGDPKQSKSVTFTVSAGDGAVSPGSGCTDVNGKVSATYTVGAAVGTATVTVSASDSGCV